MAHLLCFGKDEPFYSIFGLDSTQDVHDLRRSGRCLDVVLKKI
jgi:hypothetical protein